MKRLIAITCNLFMLYQVCLSQSTNTFSHFFAGTNPPYGTLDFVYADIFETPDSGFVTCFSAFPFNIRHAQAIFIKINKYGIEQYRKVIEDTIYHYEIGGLIKCKQYGYVGEYRRGKWGVPDQKIYLVKYNDVGDTLWTITDSVKQFTFPYGIVESYDNKIAITGFTYDTLANGQQGNADSFVIIYDSMGVKISSHIFSTTWQDAMYDIVETSDKGFFLAGYSGLGNNNRSWLVKTDSTGVFQFQKIWTNGGIGQTNNAISNLSDGNFLIVGEKNLTTDYNNNFAELRKVDSNGNIVWTKSFGNTVYGVSAFFDSKELADKSIISCGLSRDFSQTEDSWLLKTDSLGNLLWERNLSCDTIANALQKLNSCSDNGIICVGRGFDFIYGDSTQDLRIIKVDSLGCDSMGCAMYTGIEETPHNPKEDFLVYPNPSSNILNIDFKNESNATFTLEVFDITGKIILNQTTKNKQTPIDVSKIENGIYFLRVSTKVNTMIKKIIVQH